MPSRLAVTQPLVGLVVEQHGRGLEVEQAPQAIHRRVEHLVEVERGRQGLGDPVQREQQGVGVGQPSEAVEGQGLLPVGLARDATGVAGDERDEHELRCPLARDAQLVLAAHVVRHADREHRHDDDNERESSPRANPAMTMGVIKQKMNGESQ